MFMLRPTLLVTSPVLRLCAGHWSCSVDLRLGTRRDCQPLVYCVLSSCTRPTHSTRNWPRLRSLARPKKTAEERMRSWRLSKNCAKSNRGATCAPLLLSNGHTRSVIPYSMALRMSALSYCAQDWIRLGIKWQRLSRGEFSQGMPFPSLRLHCFLTARTWYAGSFSVGQDWTCG